MPVKYLVTSQCAEKQLFGFQAVNRVSQRGAYGLIPYRQPGNEYRYQNGDDKYTGGDINAKNKVLQPVAHHQVGNWRSDRETDNDQQREFSRKKVNNLLYGRPEHLAYSHLF